MPAIAENSPAGQTGGRPTAVKDLGFASADVFGAVCPNEGKAAAIIMPICNTMAMNHHLREISSQVGADAHAVVVLDGAGWHQSQALVIPDNISRLALPPYSPELNPVERIWHYLPSHCSPIRSFAAEPTSSRLARQRGTASPPTLA